MNFTLRALTTADEKAFRKALRAFDADNPDCFEFALFYEPGMDFKYYVDLLAQMESGTKVPPKMVSGALWFAFAGDEIIGRVSIRFRLNEYLSKIGGHVGYAVLPQFRRQGVATEILRRSLPVLKSKGITRALLTCDDGNIGSQKTIENCGGVLEGFYVGPEVTIRKRRYWIEL